MVLFFDSSSLILSLLWVFRFSAISKISHYSYKQNRIRVLCPERVTMQRKCKREREIRLLKVTPVYSSLLHKTLSILKVLLFPVHAQLWILYICIYIVKNGRLAKVSFSFLCFWSLALGFFTHNTLLNAIKYTFIHHSMWKLFNTRRPIRMH